MELIDLKVFVSVAEHLHFGRAGQELLYTTSHVSHRIRRLEHELGVQLFDRTTRQVHLTPKGRILLAEAQSVLIGVEGMRRIANEPDGPTQIDIAYSPASSHVLRQYLSRLPTTEAEWRVRLDPRANSNDVIRAVDDGDYTVGATQWTTSKVSSVQIGTNELALLVPANHSLAKQKLVTVEQLDGERLLIVSPEVSPGINYEIRRFFADRDISPRFEPRRITAPEHYLDLVEANQGIAIALASLPERPQVRKIALAGAVPEISNVYLVWRRGHRPDFVDAILDIVHPVVGASETRVEAALAS
ncbi:LysR family transcriptional regulator [Trebonia sp.]|uniref:LysR family transcriptional regulator n=1 Tax=Trebonia sp. TaxID=2767075 RepID=UPI00261ABDB9|nr:LysR family transcriptional regulator [Trebonia sp.]